MIGIASSTSSLVTRHSSLVTAVQTAWVAYSLTAACALISFFFHLGAIPLTSPNEGLYGETAREMVEAGKWIVPRANGVIYLEKPPLLYWASALSMSSLGQNAFAARLPSALAALATAWVLVAAGRRWMPRASGAASGVVFATSIGLVIVARQVLFDSLLTLWTTLALLSFWFGTTPDEKRPRRGPALLAVGYAALALAVMTKGLVGVALPALIVLAYVLIARDFSRLRAAWSPLGLALFVAIAAPWHIAAALEEKRFAWFYFVNEHWLRFLGRRQPADFHQDPAFSPALSLVLLTLPWGFLLPAAVRSELRERPRKPISGETVFLLCWAIVPALFFTISRTRTYYYQLPSLPALALLMGRFWARLSRHPPGERRAPWLLGPMLATALLVGGAWAFSRLAPWGSLREAAWHSLASACGGWLAAALILAVALVFARREAAAFFVVAAGVLATVVAALQFASASAQPVFRSEEPAARLITQMSPPDGTRVAVEGKFENHSSLAFYLPRRLRPVLVVDALGQGDLGFGSGLEDMRRLFVSTPTMFELTESEPLFYLTLSPSKLRVPPALQLVTCDDEVMLWTNLGGSAPRSASVR